MKTESFLLRGDLCYSRDSTHLETVAGGVLLCLEGRCAGVFPQVPEQYRGLPWYDFSGKLVVPGLADLHVHASQYAYRGLGMDMELLDWLNTNAFPEEAKFADLDYAKRAYGLFVEDLRRGATTRAAVFATLHGPATRVLMELLEASGLCAFVGKVNMDRNSLPGVLEETTEQSMSETLRWLEACGDFRLVKPMLTPRFTPSCSDELMAFLGKLAAERTLPVQSHLSENDKEIQWVRELHPDCKQYWETYAKYGLWNDRTVMAHCVWSDERERAAMRDAGVTAVHCADSNQNICSGVAPVRAMLREGLKVALGSDIAGGDQLHMFDVVASAIRASKARRILDGWETDFLTVAEGWYLGTSAGAAYFGEAPGFAPGNPLHALVLRDSDLPQPHPLTAAERLERAVYLRQKDAIRAVWSAGRKIFSRT